MATDTALHPELWSEVAEQGWLGIHLSEASGGLGLGMVDLAVVAEEMGRACFPGPFLGTVWAATLIAEANAKSKYLHPLAAGELKGAVALLEPDASWDPSDVQLQATKAGSGFKLSGRKSFVSDAAVADVIVCVARVRATTWRLLAVPAKAAGVSITADRRPGSDAQALRRHVRGRHGRGRRRAGRRRCGPRGAGTLDASGHAGRLRRHAGRHAVDHRRHRRIRENAAAVRQSDRFVPGRAAHVRRHAAVDRERALGDLFRRLGVGCRAGQRRRAVATAKVYTSDASREVANRGVQVHGGIGFTWEHDLQLYYKRSKASEILFGDAACHPGPRGRAGLRCCQWPEKRAGVRFAYGLKSSRRMPGGCTR